MEEDEVVKVIVAPDPDTVPGWGGDEILLADGFEDAFIGVCMRFGWNGYVAAYDYEKCIRILIDKGAGSREEAEEYFQYNVVGAWVGDMTPVFISGMKMDHLIDSLIDTEEERGDDD